MSLLKIFNKNENDAEKDKEKEPAISMKKKKDTMESVLQTTVLETILNDFHQLKISKITYMDDEMFIGLMLKAEDIGGLNKKSSKDRSEMIQQINGGDIKVYISDELLSKEELLLVPDAETWENIGEYSFMREALYTIQFLDEEGTIYDTKQKISYQEVENAIKNQKKLENLITQMPGEEQLNNDIEEIQEQKETEENVENSEEINEISDIDEFNEIPDEAVEFMDETPVFDDDNEDEDMVFIDEYENNNVNTDNTEEMDMMFTDIPENMDDVTVSDIMDQVEDDDMDDDEFEYDLPDGWEDVDGVDIGENENMESDIEVTEEEVGNTIFRKFYGDDLELEISMTPFYSKFVNTSDIIPFKTDRSDGWMNEQLNEKSIHYNHEIEQMHQTNISRLRILYTNLMQETVDKIRAELDINVESNWYARKYKELITKKENYDIQSEIIDYKEKLEKKWENELKQIGEDAAKIAIQKHKEKYERKHEDELFTADTYLKDKLENEYQDRLRDLNNARKIKAHQQLEVYTDSVLKKVAEEYLDMQKKETERIHEIQKEFEKFMDDHRKEDIAMAEVRQNEQKYKERLNEQLEAHRNEIEKYKRELEDKERQYKTEIENSALNYKKMMDERELEVSIEISKLKNKNTELKDAFDELNEKYQKMDETKRSEYEGKIEQIRTANIALEEEMRIKDIENKRKSSGTIILIVICVIAALAIGFMFGTTMTSTQTNSAEVTMEK